MQCVTYLDGFKQFIYDDYAVTSILVYNNLKLPKYNFCGKVEDIPFSICIAFILL